MFNGIFGQKSPKSQVIEKKGTAMSKPKPTKVVITYRDANPEEIECLYAKAKEGFFQIACQEGKEFHLICIPSGNPDIIRIEVFSEKSDRDRDREHDDRDRG